MKTKEFFTTTLSCKSVLRKGSDDSKDNATDMKHFEWYWLYKQHTGITYQNYDTYDCQNCHGDDAGSDDDNDNDSENDHGYSDDRW